MKNSFLNTTTHNVAWLHKRFIADELTLKAPFQRNPVWTVNQKSYLIDTILRGYPIPELYIQEFVDASGNDQYVVVDGQQRVRACLDYISGRFSLNEKDSPEWPGIEFEDLGDEYRKRLFNYNFVVRVLPEMEESEVRKIFSRLNRNVIALNAQELRHATYWGEFIKVMEKLADDESWSTTALFTPNDVRRMIDVEYISELAVGLIHGVQNKKNSLEKWYQSYEEEFPQKREVERAMMSALSEIVSILPDISSTRWRKKSDFYTLFLIMAEHSSALPLARDQRSHAKALLESFGRTIDEFISNRDLEVSADVKRYTQAVERAASDLANRRERRNIVQALLDPIFS